MGKGAFEMTNNELKPFVRFLSVFGIVAKMDPERRIDHIRKNRASLERLRKQAHGVLVKMEDLLKERGEEGSLELLTRANDLVDSILADVIDDPTREPLGRNLGWGKFVPWAAQAQRWVFEANRILEKKPSTRRLFASSYGMRMVEDQPRIEAAIWSGWDPNLFVKALAQKMVVTARGARNPNIAYRYLEKLAEKEGVNIEVVRAVHRVMFPKR